MQLYNILSGKNVKNLIVKLSICLVGITLRKKNINLFFKSLSLYLNINFQRTVRFGFNGFTYLMEVGKILI
jgi:hypothetical protein